MKAQHGHHVTPKKTLFTVFGALVALTILTGLTAQIDLGVFNIPLALTIAGSKAALVVLFFMALKYDNRVNALVFTLGVVFVVVFLTFTLFDTAFRGDLGNVGTETISDLERLESVMRDREEGLPEGVGTGLGLPGAEDGADTSAVSDTAGVSEAADTVASDPAGDADAAGPEQD